MPGIVPAANSSILGGVLPFSLCAVYQQSSQFPMLTNWFNDGRNVRRSLGNAPRQFWTLSKRLTSAQSATLRAFYEARKGPWQPFYFYDVFSNNFQWDPTGVTGLGRYPVCFASDLSITGTYPRVTHDFTIIQIV